MICAAPALAQQAVDAAKPADAESAGSQAKSTLAVAEIVVTARVSSGRAIMRRRRPRWSASARSSSPHPRRWPIMW